MNSHERPAQGVTFTNEPKLSGKEADRNFDEKRIALLPEVKNYLARHERFSHRPIQVTFATKGISSLVCILEGEAEKSVLKIPLATDYSRGEAEFLNQWEQHGVRVPHVLETGAIGAHEYLLMEHVDAPVLSDTYKAEEMVERKIYEQLGRTLKTMHTPQAKGFGLVKAGRGEYARFDEWINSSDMRKRVEEVKARKLLGKDEGSFAQVEEILTAHARAHPGSSYCHDDFSIHNTFATEPLTVFDPNPRFNNGYIDLGRSVMASIGHRARPESQQQLVEGYFGGDKYDQHALHAAIALAAYMRFPYWNKIQRTEGMQAVRAYLNEHRSLLQ